MPFDILQFLLIPYIPLALAEQSEKTLLLLACAKLLEEFLIFLLIGLGCIHKAAYTVFEQVVLGSPACSRTIRQL